MSHQSNTPDQREIEGILNEIKSKSTDGNYIYRGERKLYCKVSSAFYHEHQEIINTLQNDPIGGNAYSDVFDNFDLRLAQKEELKIAKNHIGETRQDIFENPKDVPAEHQRTTLKADEVDLLTQLQHYGGKTNLIDFTTDYLIATYFACAGEPNEDGRVIVLEKTPEIESMIMGFHFHLPFSFRVGFKRETRHRHPASIDGVWYLGSPLESRSTAFP
ncbi:MAG: FRG domain-containing protein [Candidatus Poribacteria bacterium]|nr:FRG domain-containing protein [Candidatus Poribacteria bacterium]